MAICLRLPDGTQISTDHLPALIGRALEADLSIPEPYSSVSRKHARIFESAGRCFVEDLGSPNGTKVDGIQISGATPLTQSCRLSLGNVETFLTLAAPSRAALGTASITDSVVVPPPVAPSPYVPEQPPYRPPIPQYAAPLQPHAPAPQPLKSSLASPMGSDDPQQLNLHRYLAWGAIGLMFLSFSMPWVRAFIFQLNYFQMLKELTRASRAAGEFGLPLQTTAALIPLLVFALALGVGALNHAVPLRQGSLFCAIAGGAGLVAAFWLYSYAATGLVVDLSGVLSSGYYLFFLASGGLLAEGTAMLLVLKLRAN